MGLLDKLFSKKQPTQKQFAEMVIKALEKRGESGLQYNETDFSVRGLSKSGIAYLANAYTDYCSAPTEETRKIALARYVSSFLERSEIPEDFEAAKPRLMPVVRDPAYFSLATLKIRADGGDYSKLATPTRAIAPGLIAALAYDSEHTIANVNQATLEKWGANFDECLELAKQHLRDRTDIRGFRQIAPGLFVTEFGDSYDSARLLLPDVLHRLNLNGDPVIFAPNRNQLWVTGAYDSASLDAILKYGPESHFGQGHSLSPNLYTISDGKIVDFLPNDPAQRELALSIRRRRDVMDYEQQKTYLNAIHAREKIEIFVGSCTHYKRKDESTYSCCVWSNGVDTLLPKAESIAFVVNAQSKDLFSVPWETALPIVSGLMELEAELAPIRYRVRSFPNAEQVARLRAVSKN